MMGLGKKWRRYRAWVAFVLVAAIAGTVFIAMRSARATDAPTTTYTTKAAEKGTLSVTVSGSGNLELDGMTEVWPDSGGTMKKLRVEEGDTVAAGAVLFTLDDSDAKAATAKALASYRQAQSGIAQSNAQVSKANASLTTVRSRSSMPSSTVTSAEIAAAKADVASAKASLTSAKAQEASARETYKAALDAEDELEVTAPVAGVVYVVNAEEGDTVSGSGGSGSASAVAAGAGAVVSSSSGSSSAPVIIVPKGPLVATLAVNEVDLPSIKLGQRADLEFDALPDLALTGKVTEIADEGTVEQGVVSFDVVIELDVENEQLKPGMSVSATIITAVARDVLLVPNSAVKSDDEGSYVQVLDSPESTPQRVAVETGLAGATETEIVSGLSEGDPVVTATNHASENEQASPARPSGMMMMGGGPR